jgi:hypothetical protein
MPDEVVEPLTPTREPEKPATYQEILDSLTGLEGVVTISAIDFAEIREHGCGRIWPITTRDQLMLGWFATFDEILSIYVSRNIPIGYFYHGPRVPELHAPVSMGARVVRSKIPFDKLMQIRLGLRPFKLTLTP